MSELERLIQQHCPNGVEFRPLEKCCQVLDNKRKPITKSAREAGEYPYYGANGIQDYVADYIFDGTFVLVGEDGSVITPNGNPVVNWAEGKIWVNNHAHIIAEIDGVLLRYLFHYLQIVNVTPLIHGNIPKLTGGDFRALKIPVPPIEVQSEIVRILDNFTELTAELKEKLAAELTARKKQYEYYTDKRFKSDIPKEKWTSVEDTIVSLKTGLNPRQNFKLNIGGDKPYITGKDIYNNSINVSAKTDLITDDVIALINRRACLATNDVLFASTGTGTVGRMAVVEYYDHTWAVSETMFCLKPKPDIIDPFYLMYALYTQSSKDQFEPKISKGSVPHLKVKDLLSVKIPVPSLSEQKRIVTIMRNFDTLYNDISAGLPAEIEARQKQYEYYRDKLLTFKEVEV